MAAREHQQHHLGIRLVVLERVEDIDDDVEDVERSPGEEEDDTDGDEQPVSLLPPLHLSCSPVRGKVLTCLESQGQTHPAQLTVKKNLDPKDFWEGVKNTQRGGPSNARPKAAKP